MWTFTACRRLYTDVNVDYIEIKVILQEERNNVRVGDVLRQINKIIKHWEFI